MDVTIVGKHYDPSMRYITYYYITLLWCNTLLLILGMGVLALLGFVPFIIFLSDPFLLYFSFNFLPFSIFPDSSFPYCLDIFARNIHHRRECRRRRQLLNACSVCRWISSGCHILWVSKSDSILHWNRFLWAKCVKGVCRRRANHVEFYGRLDLYHSFLFGKSSFI